MLSSDIDDSAESWDGVGGGISIIDGWLAEREAVEASREPSGVGYSEESEEKEFSDMTGTEMGDVDVVVASHDRAFDWTGMADNG